MGNKMPWCGKPCQQSGVVILLIMRISPRPGGWAYVLADQHEAISHHLARMGGGGVEGGESVVVQAVRKMWRQKMVTSKLGFVYEPITTDQQADYGQ